MSIVDSSPKIAKFGNGRYVVYNGWKNGRRQKIYATYNKESAEKELKSRLAGNKPKIYSPKY